MAYYVSPHAKQKVAAAVARAILWSLAKLLNCGLLYPSTDEVMPLPLGATNG